MKRTFWTGVGYTLGVGTGWYVQRRVKHTVDRYAPEQVRADVADKGRQAVTRARDTVHDLRTAANEGIAAMRSEKEDLLAEFANDEVLHTGPARAVQPGGRSNRGYRPRHGSSPE